MYFRFLTALIILVFSFQLVVGLVMLPISAVQAQLAARRPTRSPPKSFALQQIGLSIVLSAFVALVCASFAARFPIRLTWLYGVTGFLATYVVLSRNAHGRLTQPHDPLLHPDIRSIRASAADGAILGFVIGLFAFPLAYMWPLGIGVVPGTSTFFASVIALALWLSSFWIVRAIAALIAAGYVLNTGCLALLTAGTMVYAAGAALKRLLQARPR